MSRGRLFAVAVRKIEARVADHGSVAVTAERASMSLARATSVALLLRQIRSRQLRARGRCPD